MTDEERQAKRRAYLAEYRAKNRAKIAAQQKRWRDANKDRARAIRKKWADANPDQVQAINRDYYQRNREAVKANSKKWREANPEKWALIIKANKHKREARKRGVPNYSVTDRDIARLLAMPCRVDGCQRKDIQIDHIIPLARGGSHGVGNLQPLCGHHNAAKHARLWIEFKMYLRTCETSAA